MKTDFESQILALFEKISFILFTKSINFLWGVDFWQIYLLIFTLCKRKSITWLKYFTYHIQCIQQWYRHIHIPMNHWNNTSTWKGLWCEIFGFFSSRSLKMREKYTSFAQFVYFIIQKLKSKHTSLKKYTNWAKLTEQNLYIFLSFWGNERRKTKQIFRTKVSHILPWGNTLPQAKRNS